MKNIIATHPKTNVEIIVQNKVSNVRKALEYWKEWGMSHVNYSAKSDRTFTKKGL